MTLAAACLLLAACGSAVPLSALDGARMIVLLEVARTQLDGFNEDD